MARFILLLLLVIFGNVVLYRARMLAKNKDASSNPSVERFDPLEYFNVPEARIASARTVTGRFLAESTESRQQSPKSGKRMTRTSSYPHDWMDPPILEKPPLNGIQHFYRHQSQQTATLQVSRIFFGITSWTLDGKCLY